MRRETTHVMSHRPYAVDLSSLRENQHSSGTFHPTLDAVWFRRRKGVTVACVGRLWDVQSTAPATVMEFLERHDDGRYGGDCHARWDGTGYWGAESPEAMAEHLALLKPMLASYPDVPAGYDGWWTFQ